MIGFKIQQAIINISYKYAASILKGFGLKAADWLSLPSSNPEGHSPYLKILVLLMLWDISQATLLCTHFPSEVVILQGPAGKPVHFHSASKLFGLEFHFQNILYTNPLNNAFVGTVLLQCFYFIATDSNICFTLKTSRCDQITKYC